MFYQKETDSHSCKLQEQAVLCVCVCKYFIECKFEQGTSYFKVINWNTSLSDAVEGFFT